jgi:hypothetical protein
MDQFEYEFTTHGAEGVRKLVFFCSADADCGVEEVPSLERQALTQVFNDRGSKGWELVQLMFGKDGVIACWKRKLATR